MPDWPAILADYLADPCAVSCAAMPTPNALTSWAMESINELLAHHTDRTPLLINQIPALAFLSALPPGQSVGSLAEAVELASEDKAAWPGAMRMALPDAVDFVLRQSFSELHRLRFQRLRADDEALRRKQDGVRLAYASVRFGNAEQSDRAIQLGAGCAAQPALKN
jgi:hypothetical protein